MSKLAMGIHENGMHVGAFEHKGTCYTLYIYTTEDDRVEVVEDETNALILTFTADCYIQLNGHYIGHFTQRDDEILFRFNRIDLEGYMPTGVSPKLMDAYFRAEAVATKYFLDHRVELETVDGTQAPS